MHIGFAGPVTLNLINCPFNNSELPLGYPFPANAHFVNALLKRGHKVSVFSYSTGIKKPVVLESENVSFYIAVRREKKAARDFFRHEVRQLVDFYNEVNCDVLFSNWSYEFSLAALKSNKRNITTVRIRDYPPLIFRLNPDPYRFIRMLIHFYVTNNAKYLNTNSPYIYNLLSKKLQNKTITISNFFSNNLLERQEVKKENYIITVSNGFKGRKNIAKGILAFSVVRKYFPSIEYYLVGDQLGEKQEAYNFAIKNNLSEGIRFLGSKNYNETLDLISKAKFMLHPSLEESFGMSVLEAMVLGTPVIGGEQSGNIPYLLGNGQFGYLCDVRNFRAIADTIFEILVNEDRLYEIAQKAKNHAIRNYSESVVINRFENYLKSIIDG